MQSARLIALWLSLAVIVAAGGRGGSPASSTLLASLSPTAPLLAVVMVKHCEDKIRQLDDLFWAVSDPASPSVGVYPAREVVGELLRPCNRTVSAVEQVCIDGVVTAEAV